MRQLGVLQAAAGKLDWDAVPKLSDDPLPGLFEIVNRILEHLQEIHGDISHDGKSRAGRCPQR